MNMLISYKILSKTPQTKVGGSCKIFMFLNLTLADHAAFNIPVYFKGLHILVIER